MCVRMCVCVLDLIGCLISELQETDQLTICVKATYTQQKGFVVLTLTGVQSLKYCLMLTDNIVKTGQKHYFLFGLHKHNM